MLPLASPFCSGSTHSSISSAERPISSAPTNTKRIETQRFRRSPQLSLSAATAEITGRSEKQNVLSRLLFRYASPVINKASRQHLDESDAHSVPQGRKMEACVSNLTKIYNEIRKEAARDTKSAAESWLLTKALLLHNRRRFIGTGMLRLLNTLIQAFPAILVRRLLGNLESQASMRESMTTAMTLVLVLTVKMIIENQYFDKVVRTSTVVRGSLAGMIFDKSLRLPNGGANVAVSRKSGSLTNSTETLAPLGSGGVLNLMQSDAGLLESAALQLHTLWDGPLQIAVYTYLLYRYLGSSVFWGISVLLATIPINSITLRILNKLSRRENESKDARTKRTAESIANMKLLKLVGWEERFADGISKHRATQLAHHSQRGIVRAFSNAVSNAVPALVLVVTLTAYTRAGRPMTASTIFTAISLFNQLRFPLFFYPMLIDSLANGFDAARRLSTFLSAPELTPYVEQVPSAEGRITLENGNFLWPGTSGDLNATTTELSPALVNAELQVTAGEIAAVVGTVGSGKTALLKSLLGELTPVPSTTIQHLMNNISVTDTTALKPTVVVSGEVAYCSQEAWLPKGSLRDSVVFGREYDEDRYRRALFDAGLDRDIVEDSKLAEASQGTLSHETDVGEGGSSLSGGQRARVALARALYSDAKVFLLDDSLAALDASVGLTVLERLTCALRERRAAALLVTNDPSVPRRCDRVYLMANVQGNNWASSSGALSCSTILDVGTYEELVARGHNLKTTSAVSKDGHETARLATTAGPMQTHHSSKMKANSIGDHYLSEGVKDGTGFVTQQNETENLSWSHADPEHHATLENCPDYVSDCNLNDVSGTSDKSVVEESSIEFVTNDTITSTQHKDEERDEPATLSSADDNMSSKAVSWSTYVSYYKAAGKPLLVIAMLASYLMVNGAQFFQQYTVAKWTDASSSGNLAAAMGADYMRSLVNAAGIVSIFLWLRSFLLMRVGVRASDFLHSRMLQSVFAAPMSFFDATPSGQILSRFGKEMETVDRGVPDSIGSVLYCFLQIFMSVGALAAIITPGMLGPLGLVAFAYVRTMSRFRPAARDMKRAETKTRSPIYTQFGEALRGTETIRSVPGAKDRWSRDHKVLTDDNLAVFFTVKSLDRWLATRLESLGNVVVFTAAFASVLLSRAGKMQAGSAGWGLTQALAITGLMTWAVRCLTDLETSMLSVMRLKELTSVDEEHSGSAEDKQTATMPVEPRFAGEALELLRPKATTFVGDFSPSNSLALIKDGWPWRGHIDFHEVSMRYNPSSPLVLKNVSLSIGAGTTLGVVGRTGSGKSSLLLTLFRLNEIEQGAIEIDGVDLRSVSLSTLRQSLAIIPQDPVLFAGTVAYNLDSSGQASEAEMWKALEAASPSLAGQFRSEAGLTSLISEGGRNLSLGQRQLLCLARALLRRSKILVLDEATSSVDALTDEQVQRTIRREFVDRGVTVMTVAHRLETVLGYDKIAVLGDGKVVEYGSPKELLSLPNGELRRLVDADRRRKLGTKNGAAAKASTSLMA